MRNLFQNVLLAQLGVSPWNQETWPLQVFSRTLSVLAQVKCFYYLDNNVISSILICLKCIGYGNTIKHANLAVHTHQTLNF